jgi:hypothetical protein
MLEISEQKQQIYDTRYGGLGGSDAKMVLKIGKKGIESLSQSDINRLAVMTGQIDYKSTPTNIAMQRGNEFEQWLADNVFAIPNNELIPLPKNPYSFKVFAHADFYKSDVGFVYEAKFTKDDIQKTAETYKAQLQWYYMLGAKKVYLVHGNSEIEFDHYSTIEIERDETIISHLIKGLELIEEYIKDFVFEPKEEWTEQDLLPFDKQDALAMYSALEEIKRLEAYAEEYKDRLKKMFEMYNIKSLKAENYTITYIPESVSNSFDKAKLFKEHPEIKEDDYTKKSPKKSYLKINLKQ